MKQIVLLNVKPSYTLCSMMQYDAFLFCWFHSFSERSSSVVSMFGRCPFPLLSAWRLLDPTEVGVKPWETTLGSETIQPLSRHNALIDMECFITLDQDITFTEGKSVLGLTGETGSEIIFLILPSSGDQEVCYRRVKCAKIKRVMRTLKTRSPTHLKLHQQKAANACGRTLDRGSHSGCWFNVYLQPIAWF